jgi:diguanylate cyclase (GGDEF)-like protein/PAS domain S-box-containing protein
MADPTGDRRDAHIPLNLRAHLDQAQRIAGISTWTVDHQTDELFWSEGVYGLLGVDPGAFQPTFESFWALVHPEDRQTVQRAFADSLAGEKPYDIVYRVVIATGVIRYLKARSETHFDSDGRPLRSYGAVQDITESELTRVALEQETQRLRDVLTATETATWEWNVQTGEARFSERWANIIGYKLDELAPVDISTWTDLCHPDDLAKSEELLQAHFSGAADLYSHEARMRHKNGHWVWVLDRGRVTEWDSEGNPVWMYGTHQEITEKKNAEKAQEAALERLRKLTDQVPGAIYQFQQWPDGSTAMPFASKGLNDVYGVDPESVQLDAAQVFERIHPDDIAEVINSIQKSYRTLDTWHCEHRAITDAADSIWLEGTAQPERQSDGSVIWHGFVRDFTERKRSEEQLREAASVFKYANEGIFMTDLEGTITDANEAFTAITGYTRQEAIGKNPKILQSGRHSHAFYKTMFKTLHTTGKWSSEIWNRRKDGQEFVARQTVSVIKDGKGEPFRYLSLFSDITEFKENEERLRQLSERDPLTGLPNRLELARQLVAAISRAVQKSTPLAVAYIDLDDFKAINDANGHPTGDQVLRIVGSRLASSFRHSDILGRIGGDEFVAIIEQVSPGRSMDKIMLRVLSDMRKAFRVGDQSFYLSASIGVSWLRQDEPLDGDQLIRQADQAMYQAKQAGRDRYHSFDADKDHQVRQVNSLIKEVERGIDADEFHLFYQPKANMETGEIIGAEALIRWFHPQKGLLSPVHFLPEIDGHDVMRALGFWVMNSAAGQICRWKTMGYRLPVSINMDGYTLLQPDFLSQLKKCLNDHPDLKPGDLEIEVLETSALRDIKGVRLVIEECAALGVGFSIDDFGTGYSSLSYLKQLPAELLKIDTSFVRHMLEDPDDLSILSGILGLAKSFRRRCIAEGVETIEHGLLLLASGCVLGQGYAIARPMPAEDIKAWVDSWTPPDAWTCHGEVVGSETQALFEYVQHRVWLSQFKRFLADPNESLPPLDEKACSFGQWISEKGAADEPGRSLPQPIVDAHARLHRSATVIADEILASGSAATAEHYEEIRLRHVQFVSHLESYLNARLQGDSGP